MVTQIWFNTGSGNGLLPDSTKPLSLPNPLKPDVRCLTICLSCTNPSIWGLTSIITVPTDPQLTYCVSDDFVQGVRQPMLTSRTIHRPALYHTRHGQASWHWHQGSLYWHHVHLASTKWYKCNMRHNIIMKILSLSRKHLFTSECMTFSLVTLYLLYWFVQLPWRHVLFICG